MAFPYSALIDAGKFANGNVLKRDVGSQIVIELAFQMKLSDSHIEHDFLYLVFDDEAQTDIDLLDAKKLFPLREANKLFAIKNNTNMGYTQLSLPFVDLHAEITEWGNFAGEIQLKPRLIRGVWNGSLTLTDRYDSSQKIDLSMGETVTFYGKPDAISKTRNSNNLVLDEAEHVRFDLFISPTVSTASEVVSILYEFRLNQNYPNPFNPTTSISFELAQSDEVELLIFNALGQKVATLVHQSLSRGKHEVQFDATGLPSGLYLYRLQSSSKSISKKMMLIK